ncbi:hypothetical protein GWI33_008177 [Rhynchophorus ferrugineus]|uniref:Uncharacterized protein n=1 Tax=Rhynchophorus ferrugineus TaxID=354439 RepID=A0A834IRH3_RHYFE|nr:hypothetical protein GWI33_008177 [Rhynchophorus ferrugineus]
MIGQQRTTEGRVATLRDVRWRFRHCDEDARRLPFCARRHDDAGGADDGAATLPLQERPGGDTHYALLLRRCSSLGGRWGTHANPGQGDVKT